MKGVITQTVRQLKIESPKAIPLLTEIVEKKKAILRSKTGFIEIAPNHLTRDIKKFLVESGMTIEEAPHESRRGKAQVNGVPVKVLPIRHTHYDGGVFVRIKESDEMSYSNTNKVIQYLTNNGINIAKECVFVTENTEEGACLKKMEE